MSQTQALHDGTGIILKVPGVGIMHAVGSTVPSDGTAGYGPGCIFQDQDAAAGSQVYINEGSYTSCDFNAVVSVSATATLTGKTLTSPTITTPTITSPSLSGSLGNDGDFYSTDFNPAVRVFARSDFGKKLYTKAVGSDWTSFKSVASADWDWYLSGNPTTYGGKASSDGGTVLSGSNNSKLLFMKPSTGSKFRKIAWNTSKSPRFRAVIKIGSAMTRQDIVVGLYSSCTAKAVSGTPFANRAEFKFTNASTTSSKLHWRVGNGTSSTSGAASASVAASTVYDLEIRVDSSRIASFYVNNTLIGTSALALQASKNLFPVIGIRSRGTAKNTLSVYHIMCSRNI